MLFKTILVFLLGMVLIGMVGKALFPGALTGAMRRKVLKPPVCGRCGRYVIGKTCACKKG
ncbi:MAG: hypothetical protein K9G71_03215 [Rhodobacteraceae bacterium]|nr:hypothetical protein [Paracoccaceae bacterium]MCF8513516.1 hypothetical protein [Paracoccaceae bacterium]MCF8517584.1 hypothetical protein [Paracoccaceae bacterium]